MDEVKRLRTESRHREAAELLRKLPCTLQACEEWAILSFYLGELESGQFHVTAVELTAYTKEHHDLALSNAIWYASPLSLERTTRLDVGQLQPHFAGTNPGIVANGEGYLVTVRAVNYRQKLGRIQEIPSEFNGIVISRNYLLELGSNFEVVSEVPIVDPALVSVDQGKKYRGMEDLRPYRSAEGQLRASFTLINTSPRANGAFRIGRVGLGADGATTEAVEMSSPFAAACEKNWLPFCFRGRDAFLYSMGPTTIVDDNGAVIHQVLSAYNLSGFKGSAGPINYRGGYLVVAHEWSPTGEGRRYFHRFVHFDKEFVLVDVSRPFVFEHAGVEMCVGMAPRGQKGIVLGYGFEDREARLALVSWTAVDAMWLNFGARMEGYLHPQIRLEDTTATF